MPRQLWKNTDDEDKKKVREHLMDLCLRAVVPQEHWSDRDTSGAQLGVGQAYMLLAAGCDFEICTAANAQYTITDDNTIWVKFTYKGFNYFEGGLDPDEDLWSEDTFYIPTDERLKAASGKDWY